MTTLTKMPYSRGSLAAVVKIHCSIGIMAHNEEANIGNLLDALIHQEQEKTSIDEIIVVASGCTDFTEDVVRQFAQTDSRVRLITQPYREGKASAVNLFINAASSEILVLQSADTLPTPSTIEQLVKEFSNPDIGMIGGHPIPLNDKCTLIGYAGHLIWELHHQVSLRNPKCGELVAWRNSFLRISQTAVDEANIEALIATQGWRIAYAPEAIVYNRAPMSVSDFIKQRRRIWAGHLQMKKILGYRVSTMNAGPVLLYLWKSTKMDLKSIFWTVAVVMLEQYARLLGTYDVMFGKKDHTTWDVVRSTKVLSYDEQPCTSNS